MPLRVRLVDACEPASGEKTIYRPLFDARIEDTFVRHAISHTVSYADAPSATRLSAPMRYATGQVEEDVVAIRRLSSLPMMPRQFREVIGESVIAVYRKSLTPPSSSAMPPNYAAALWLRLHAALAWGRFTIRRAQSCHYQDA